MGNKLTLDKLKIWKNVKTLTPADRVAMANDPQGQYWLSLLTPAQYAELFPGYYKNQVPDIGKALSGGSAVGGSSGMATAAPERSSGGNYRYTPDRPSAGNGSASGGSSGSAVTSKQDNRPAWQKALDKAADAKDAENMPDGGPVSVDKNGIVNKQQYYNAAVKTFANSSLNGFVPADGAKYGIDGTPQSWAKFAMRITKVESGFKVGDYNSRDPGGSLGLFQWGNNQWGINEKNWQDPQAQLNAFVKYSEKYVVKGGGYIRPPKDVKAERYHGYGGFAAAFSTVRNNRIQRQDAIDEAEKIASEMGPMPSSVQKPSNSMGQKADIQNLRPDEQPQLHPGLQKYLDSLPDTQEGRIEKRTIQSRIDKVGVTNANQIWEKNQVNNDNPVKGLSNRVNELQGQVADIRKGKIQPRLQKQLNYAASQNGVYVDVVSGGQRMEGAPGATGSHRHDHGNAADLKLYRLDSNGNKQYLSMNNKEDRAVMQNFLRDSVKAGATGIGAANDYMGEFTMHVGGGEAAAWGGGGSSKNVPDWVSSALQEGMAQQKNFNLDDWYKEQQAQSVQPVQEGAVQGQPQNQQSDFPITDMTEQAGFGYQFGKLEGGKAAGLTVHHTSGRGNAEGVINTFKERNYPAQFIMDRDGKVYRALPEGAQGQHMRKGQGPGEGLSNSNMEGIEVIAKNNKDWTPAQMQSMDRFARWHAQKNGYDPRTKIFGHGEINPHKQADEGMAWVQNFRDRYDSGDWQNEQVQSEMGPMPSSVEKPTPMSQRGLTSYAGMTAEPVKNTPVARPYINLNSTPTQQEVDSMMAQGTNTFHYDPNNKGAADITKYIQSKGGKSVGYWQGGGDKNYGEKELDLASPEGLKAIKEQAQTLQAQGYSAMQIDNLGKVKSAADMKKIFEAAGDMKIVPNGNPQMLDQMLKADPKMADKIEYGLYENASHFDKQNLDAMSNVGAQVPTYNIEYGQGKQATTLEEAQTLQNQYNLQGIYHYNQGEGENGTGGVSGNTNLNYIPSEPKSVVSPAMIEPLRPVPPAAPQEAPQAPQAPTVQAPPPPAPQSSNQTQTPSVDTTMLDSSQIKEWPASQDRAMKRATLGGQDHWSDDSPSDYA